MKLVFCNNISFNYIISRSFLGKITSLMFVFLCFAYPISAVSSLIMGLPSTLVNVSYRGFVLFIAFYVILVSCLFYRIVINKGVIPLILFLVFYLLRIFWDTVVLQVTTFHTLTEIYSFYLGGIFFPVIAIIFAFKYIDPKKVFFQIFCVLFITNSLMLFYYLSQRGFVFSPDMLLFRAEIKGADEEISILNPISFGLYGGYLMLFCLWTLLMVKKKFSKIVITSLYFLTILGLINLILSTSRGPFLFTLIGVVFLIFMHFTKAKFNVKYWFKLLSISLIIGALFLTVFQFFNKEGIDIGVFDRVFNTVENIQSGEKEERNDFFDEAFSMFCNSPIIGDRVVLKSTGGFPHNAIFETLMATGLIGFLLYFLTVVKLLINFLSFKRYSEYYSLIMSLFILSLGMSFTSGNLYQNIDNWNLIAVLLCWPKYTNEIH
jgi:O-antigen ligase